ncbi:MAG TPA: hypothetical protein PL166_13755, partial [Candidatus Contendobacter sp.]|nr:hypothetical protein [Candidatus Contendobacter sp.]
MDHRRRTALRSKSPRTPTSPGSDHDKHHCRSSQPKDYGFPPERLKEIDPNLQLARTPGQTPGSVILSIKSRLKTGRADMPATATTPP